MTKREFCREIYELIKDIPEEEFDEATLSNLIFVVCMMLSDNEEELKAWILDVYDDVRRVDREESELN